MFHIWEYRYGFENTRFFGLKLNVNFRKAAYYSVYPLQPVKNFWIENRTVKYWRQIKQYIEYLEKVTLPWKPEVDTLVAFLWRVAATEVHYRLDNKYIA